MTNENKEKVAKLTKYANSVRDKMTSPIPIKHEHNVENYTRYLELELENTMKKIESLKLDGGSK